MRIFSLVFAAWTLVHAQPSFENYETIESAEELANVRTWIGRLQEDPRETAHEFVDFFRLLPAHAWVTSFRVELKALDLIAYYVELERARELGHADPAHRAYAAHAEYYARRVNPLSHRAPANVLSSTAHVFADAFLRELERDADVPRRYDLYQRMFGAGRAFWVDHILEQIFVRSVPSAALLGPLVSHVRDRDFARVARVIARHRDDFRPAQTIVDMLVAARTNRDPGAAEDLTGEARCDQMLARAYARRSRGAPGSESKI